MARLVLAIVLISMVPAAGAGPQSHAKRTAAAPPAANKGPWPIASLSVHGNKVYSAEQVLTVAGLKVGDRVAAADFEAARQRLLASGAFQKAGYRYQQSPDGKGYLCTLEVVEEDQMYPVVFEDLPAPDAKLREFLKQKDPLFGPKIPATQPFIDREKDLLEEYLKPLGFAGTIKPRLTPEFGGDLSILFRPSTPRATIAEVHFVNTVDIPWQTLQTAIAGTAIGSSFTEPRMREWLDASIRTLYEAKGHLRVAFPAITTAPAKDVKGLSVTVRVVEGPLYTLAAIRAEGADGLDRLLQMKAGGTANFDQVRAAQGRMEDSLRRKGYLHVGTEVKRSVDDAKHTVGVVIQVIPGAQYLTGKLDIRGLDILTEPAIRKLWGLPEGKPFNAEYPSHFLNVIRDEGIMENLGKTRAEPAIHDDTHTVDVTLYFEGAKKLKKDGDGLPEPGTEVPHPHTYARPGAIWSGS